MTIYCKLGDKNSIITYKFNNAKEEVVKIQNVPIEVISNSNGDNSSGLVYEVITEITATWRRTDPPQEILSVRTVQFKNNTDQVPLSISFTPTNYRSVPNGFSFYGYETAILNLPNGIAPGGANNGGLNGTTNIVSISGSFDATSGIYCDAQTNSARIVSVKRISGICFLEVLHNSQRLFKYEGECPVTYSVVCDSDCPPGTIKCLSTNYPGYCCIPCSEIKNEIKAIASQVRSLQ